jgi:hypothetical protein
MLVGKIEPSYLSVGMQISTTTMENSTKAPPKKLKLELLYDPAIPLLGIYLKECKSGYNKDTYLHTHMYCSIIHNS